MVDTSTFIFIFDPLTMKLSYITRLFKSNKDNICLQVYYLFVPLYYLNFNVCALLFHQIQFFAWKLDSGFKPQMNSLFEIFTYNIPELWNRTIYQSCGTVQYTRTVEPYNIPELWNRIEISQIWLWTKKNGYGLGSSRNKNIGPIVVYVVVI